MNLDGGGSTTLNLFGMTMNRVSDGKERAVANGVTFQGPKRTPFGAKLSVTGPAQVSIKETRGFKVKMNGYPVPNSEVFWTATGAAWVDQGGYLRPLKEGPATLRAFAWGRRIEKSVTVTR